MYAVFLLFLVIAWQDHRRAKPRNGSPSPAFYALGAVILVYGVCSMLFDSMPTAIGMIRFMAGM